MSYRDDLASALARAEAAEKDLAATRDELTAAQAGTVPPKKIAELEGQLAVARARLQLIPAAMSTALILALVSLVLLVALISVAERNREDRASQRDCVDRVDRLELLLRRR